MKRYNILYFLFFCITIGCLMSCNAQGGVNYKMTTDTNPSEEKLFAGIEGIGNFERVKEAVEEGADVNMFHNKQFSERTWRNELESNPFLISLFGGNKQIASYLIDCGADVDYVNKYGRSLLSYCAEFDDSMIPKITEKGANINYIDKNGYTALDYAIKAKRIDAVEFLLQYHPNILSETIQRNLDELYEKPDNETTYQIIDKLLKADKTVDFAVEIKYAFLGETVELISMIKQNEVKREQMPVVASAIAAFGNQECLKYVLDHTTVSNTLSLDHLFRMASMFGNIENMNFLLTRGANINGRDINDCSALELAVHNNQFQALKMLIDLNADLTPSTDNYIKDALYFAVKNNNLEMVKLLLPTRYFNLTQAAAKAIENGNSEILIYFLDMGLDSNCEFWTTNLFGGAAENHNFEAMDILLIRGGDINDGGSGKPLKGAIERGYTDVVKYLIDHGADVNYHEVNEDGSTGEYPIIVAIQRGQLESLKLLIDAGAKIDDIYYGKNIVEFAKEQGSKNIYNYLQSRTQGRTQGEHKGTVLLCRQNKSDKGRGVKYTFHLMSGVIR